MLVRDIVHLGNLGPNYAKHKLEFSFKLAIIRFFFWWNEKITDSSIHAIQCRWTNLLLQHQWLSEYPNSGFI